MSRLGRALILAMLAAIGSLTTVAAQGPEPVDQPPEFAAIRAEFENLTLAQVRDAGYVPEPACISQPDMGGMGIHAINPTLFDAQFPTAEPDIENPPIVLLSADMSSVVGLEWEAADIGQGEMELFGHDFPLLPGHPGLPEPHYMFHAYFRPDGQVLFSLFDPELSCTLPDTALAAPDTSAILGWALVGLAALTVGCARLSRPQRR